MAGGNSGSNNGRIKTEGSRYLDVMNLEKQNRHIPGEKEYKESKSHFNISAEELDDLIRKYLDKAEVLPNGKMIIDLPVDIGVVKSRDGQILGATNRITLHKSKTGYHAVPATRGKKKGGK